MNEKITAKEKPINSEVSEPMGLKYDLRKLNV